MPRIAPRSLAFPLISALLLPLLAFGLTSCASIPEGPPRPAGDLTPEGMIPRSVDPELTVIICTDGVPLSMMRDLWDSGYFRVVHRPVPLVSTFPAITEIMLTEFYGVPHPAGYGLRYFDEDENRLRGNIFSAEEVSVWFSLYDYVTPMIHRGITYLHASWAASDLRRLRRLIDETDSGTLLVHLDTTDALAHYRPSRDLERFLIRLSGLLEEKYEERGGGISYLLFSDHGNNLTTSTRIPLERVLLEGGFNPGPTIEGDSGVALLPTGLISVAYLYTSPENEAEVARICASAEGVLQAVREESGIVYVHDSDGYATIERHDDSYRYDPVTSDPFDLEGVLPEGFVPNDTILDLTIDREYPDCIDRAWGGVNGHVENVADVMLSLEDGRLYGSRVISFFYHFRGTHGSLTRGSILGYCASSEEPGPRVIEAEDCLDYFGLRVRIPVQ